MPEIVERPLSALGSAVAALNSPDAKAEFGLPVEAFAVAPIIVGIPSGPTGEAPSRRHPEVICWK